MQSATNHPRRQHADYCVRDVIQGHGNGRGVLNAQPELDGIELPRPKVRPEPEEVRNHQRRESLRLPQSRRDQWSCNPALDEKQRHQGQNPDHDQGVRVRRPRGDGPLRETEQQTYTPDHSEERPDVVELAQRGRFLAGSVGDRTQRGDSEKRSHSAETRKDGIGAEDPRQMRPQCTPL